MNSASLSLHRLAVVNSCMSHFLFHSLYVVRYKMRRRRRILIHILYVAYYRTFAFSHFALYTFPHVWSASIGYSHNDQTNSPGTIIQIKHSPIPAFSCSQGTCRQLVFKEVHLTFPFFTRWFLKLLVYIHFGP